MRYRNYREKSAGDLLCSFGCLVVIALLGTAYPG